MQALNLDLANVYCQRMRKKWIKLKWSNKLKIKLLSQWSTIKILDDSQVPPYIRVQTANAIVLHLP